MQLLDRTAGTTFFLPGRLVGRPTAPPVVGGGQPLLWQHLFWFYSHPAVYIMILPAMGMVSDIISTFARKPLFGYQPMVYAIAGIAGLGFIVWGHHMFQSGMNPRLGTDFMLATMMIALPSADEGLQLARHDLGRQHPVHDARCSTRWRSWRCSSSAGCPASSWPPRRSTCTSTTPTSSSPTSTTCCSAASIFGIFAAIYYWFPKMFGRMMNEPLGQGPLRPDVHLLQRHVLPDAHHRHARPPAPDRRPDGLRVPARLGHAGHERVHDLSARSCLGLTQLIFAFNFFYSLFGRPAAPGATRGRRTRWSGPTPSPPPHGNFETIPTVYHAAYEYSVPGRRRRLPPPDRAQARRGRAARPGHGLTSARSRRPGSSPRGVLEPSMSTTPDAEPRSPETPPRGPHAVAVVAAVFTWPLIFVGGLVTTYRVGMAVPDWPTTFGMNMFLFRFWEAAWGVFIEHGHRLYGAAVGLATLVLAVWFVAADRRASMKALGVARAPGGDRPGGPGGLPGPAQLDDPGGRARRTAQAFFALMVALCVLTGRGWSTPPATRGRRRAPQAAVGGDARPDLPPGRDRGLAPPLRHGHRPGRARRAGGGGLGARGGAGLAGRAAEARGPGARPRGPGDGAGGHRSRCSWGSPPGGSSGRSTAWPGS